LAFPKTVAEAQGWGKLDGEEKPTGERAGGDGGEKRRSRESGGLEQVRIVVVNMIRDWASMDRKGN